ncbi:DUF2141 domain-containing protein [Marinoscillum sp. 108]|jgi:uncharacterized protein (DUF2141 family)|uniref:DUF2141 domain-containing protein n=1 Tax=Marinoscillum luteum TaxID=861051 RepID=A0ABW7N897_9BACT|nr:DUF2141 domain-containing protein [Marinoscillum sp. 108]VXD11451.1 conserved hypothetical protein [Marinoscillum sp. 108]
MKTILLLLALSYMYPSVGQSPVNFTVYVKQFAHQEGKLRVALFNSEGKYLKEACREMGAEIDNLEVVSVTFEGLPSGEYAISIYHDENGNGQLDANFMGIPTEDYAFSNNAPSRFGPASYSDARIEVSTNNNTHTINLN